MPFEISALILFQLISMMLHFKTFFDFSTFASVVNSVVSVASLATAGWKLWTSKGSSPAELMWSFDDSFISTSVRISFHDVPKANDTDLVLHRLDRSSENAGDSDKEENVLLLFIAGSCNAGGLCPRHGAPSASATPLNRNVSSFAISMMFDSD